MTLFDFAFCTRFLWSVYKKQQNLNFDKTEGLNESNNLNFDKYYARA